MTTVLELLYPTTPAADRGVWPGTRSVTLVLCDMDGVAYTRGRELDDDHKEIHLSLKYVASIGAERVREEVRGVVVHEMVHCWQWNGGGEAPGGLVEGMADWVRLRAGLAPPHWKRKKGGGGGRWDAGYQYTAWFLDWLEGRFGAGTVPRLNRLLKEGKYEEREYWRHRSGLHKTVQELWREYQKWLADEDHAGKANKDQAEKVDGDEERREGKACKFLPSTRSDILADLHVLSMQKSRTRARFRGSVPAPSGSQPRPISSRPLCFH